MLRYTITLSLLFTASVARGQTPDYFGPAGGRRDLPTAEFLKQLDKPRDFKGISDPKTPLEDALEYVSDIYGLTIIVDVRALEAAGIKDGIETTLGKRLTANRNATARQVLQAIVSAVSAQRKASVLVFLRREYIEITTVRGLLRKLSDQWGDLKYWADRAVDRTLTTYRALLTCPREELLDLLPELIPVEELADVFAQVAILAYTVDCVLGGVRQR